MAILAWVPVFGAAVVAVVVASIVYAAMPSPVKEGDGVICIDCSDYDEME